MYTPWPCYPARVHLRRAYTSGHISFILLADVIIYTAYLISLSGTKIAVDTRESLYRSARDIHFEIVAPTSEVTTVLLNFYMMCIPSDPIVSISKFAHTKSIIQYNIVIYGQL